MASSLGFTANNCNYLKCWFVLVHDGREVFETIFRWGYQRSPNSIKESLFELPSYSNARYRSDFDSMQRVKIESGDISNFDINLYYLLIQKICPLPPSSGGLWSKKGDKNSLPALLYNIKYKRNTLAHTNVDITDAQMLKEIDDLKLLFSNSLDVAASLFSVPLDTVNEVKDKINVHIFSVQSSNAIISQKSVKEIIEEKVSLVASEASVDLRKSYSHFLKVPLAPWTVPTTFQNVKDIFTEPVLRQSKNNILFQQLTEEESLIQYQDVLSTRLPDNSIPNFIVVLSASGMGKTTLVKYLIQSWMERNNFIKALDLIDLILYMDCRSSPFQTVEDFLASLMPNTVSIFDRKELKSFLKMMQVLVILDNVDELSGESLPVFDELLRMNSDSFRILATSTQSLSRIVSKKCLQSHLTLQLEGISSSNISSCISKIYSSLYTSKEEGSKREEVEMFVSEYISKSHLQSSDSVRSPEILSHVFFHWLMESKKNYSYTTKTHLFLTTHELLSLKLLEKAGNKSQTKLFEQKLLYDRLNIFFNELFRIAFQTIESLDTTLSSSAFAEIIEVCRRLEIPCDVIKDILCIKEKTGSNPHHKDYVSAAFPSVSQHVFYSAMHVANMFTTSNFTFEDLLESFYENAVRRNFYIMFMKFLSGILASSNLLILEENLKNIFVHVNKYYPNCTTSTWVDIIEETKCHPPVMQEAIGWMGDTWTLEDHEMSAGLITLLQTYHPKHLILIICKPPTDIYFLKRTLELITQIPKISLTLNIYYHFWVKCNEKSDAYFNILRNSPGSVSLESFAGKLSAPFILKIPSLVKRLALQISPQDVAMLNSILHKFQDLLILYVNLNINFEFPAKRLSKLKLVNSNTLLYVDIWNITDRDVEWACDIISSLSPAYSRLALRKSSLDFKSSLRLLEGLRERRIHLDTLTIGSIKTFTEKEVAVLSDQANDFECNKVNVIKL